MFSITNYFRESINIFQRCELNDTEMKYGARRFSPQLIVSRLCAWCNWKSGNFANLLKTPPKKKLTEEKWMKIKQSLFHCSHVGCVENVANRVGLCENWPKCASNVHLTPKMKEKKNKKKNEENMLQCYPIGKRRKTSDYERIHGDECHLNGWHWWWQSGKINKILVY